ncbi:MAG: hypothetical protein V2A71_04740 [Candidatus Eisenbacteria bacterium]
MRFRILDAMYREAVELGVFPLKDPTGGLEADLANFIFSFSAYEEQALARAVRVRVKTIRDYFNLREGDRPGQT